MKTERIIFFRRGEGSKVMMAKVSSTDLTLSFQKLSPLKGIFHAHFLLNKNNTWQY